MAYSFHRIILFISLVFTVAVPSSSGDSGNPEWAGKLETEKYLRDLCNETKECLDFIESKLNRFNDAKPVNVIGIAIDLAIEKAYAINDELDRLYNSSTDETLKNKYLSCFYNYHSAIYNLGLAKFNFANNYFQLIPILVQNTVNQLDSCSGEFAENSFDDPPHIMNINKELGIFVEFLQVATLSWYSQNHQG